MYPINKQLRYIVCVVAVHSHLLVRQVVVYFVDSEDGKEIEEEEGDESKDGDAPQEDVDDNSDADDNAEDATDLASHDPYAESKAEESLLKKFSAFIDADSKSPISVPSYKDSKVVFPTNAADSDSSDAEHFRKAPTYVSMETGDGDRPMTSIISPYVYSKSPAPSSPVDYDQPLDLSRKPKTSASVSRKSALSGNYRKRATSSNHDDAKPLDLRVEEPCSSDSLFNLEKRFGSKSTILEGLGSKHQPPRNPIYQAFGGSLFTNALYNQPNSATDQVYRPNRSYWSSSVSSVLQQKSPGANRSQFQQQSTSTPVSSTMTSKHSSVAGSGGESNKQAVSNGGSKDDSHKHTNLICGCKRQFETLYELTIHMQKTGHTPTSGRAPDAGEYPKLVRGQDMWLNQGSEQTRQILRCMQCGESFKTLPELTIHMMKTRHYTGIVGAEANKKVHKCSSYCDKCPEHDSSDSVFRCQVCNDNFKDLDSLTNHMMISGHHRKRSHANSESDNDEEHMFSKPSSGKNSPDISPKQSPAAKVKKLNPNDTAGSTTKRASHTHHNSGKLSKSAEKHHGATSNIKQSEGHSRHAPSQTCQVRCENCGDKIETALFVQHVRQCVKSNTKVADNTKVVDAIKAKIKPEDEARAGVSSPEIKDRYTKNEKNCSSPKTPLVPARKVSNYKDWLGDKKSLGKDVLLDPLRPKSPTSSGSGSLPILHSTTPDRETSGASALKAMESFIERSFTGGFNKPSFFGPTKPNIANVPRFSQYFPKTTAQKQECPLPDSTQNLPAHHKYLPPDFGSNADTLKPTGPPTPRQPSPKPPESEEESGGDDNEEIDKKMDIKPDPDETESRNSDPQPATPKSDRTGAEDERPDSNCSGRDAAASESPKPIHKKYLVSDSNPDQEANNNSALESLQGLVYGKSLTTEHPLDSLQKLIHNTDGGSNGRPNGSQSVMAGTATFQPGMPSTVILVNPIVTVVPNTSAPPAVQINISRDSSPPTACQTSPSAGSVKGGGSDKGGDSDGEPGEYRCQACSRTFMSKGSYRYHLSRCHLSTVKKYGFKEAFNMSPYVYLPLDHSAKFSKYYEMANELANKGSEAASPPPVSPEEVANQS